MCETTAFVFSLRLECFIEPAPRMREAAEEKWTPKIGQRDKCFLGLSCQLGSGFVVHAVRRAPVKRLMPSLGVVENEVPPQ